MADKGKRITKPTFGFFSREKKFPAFPASSPHIWNKNFRQSGGEQVEQRGGVDAVTVVVGMVYSVAA